MKNDVRVTWQVGSGSILGTPDTAKAVVVRCTDDTMILAFTHEPPGEEYQFERWATSPCAGEATEENKNWWYEVNNCSSPVAIERM